MRITNLRRRIAAALMAAGLAVPGVASAAPLDTNLVVNPSFENVDPSVGGASGSVLILDWQGNGFAYAYSQDYDNGGPLAGGGDYYFNGGNGDGGQPIFQDIDVSTGASAAEIAAGTAGYDVSAFFSSYLTQGDFGNVTVRFLDAGEVELGSGTLSDSDTSTWTSETLRGAIPQQTALVRLESQGTAVAGAPDGYVDLVDFRVVHGLAALDLFLAAVVVAGLLARIEDVIVGPEHAAGHVAGFHVERLRPGHGDGPVRDGGLPIRAQLEGSVIAFHGRVVLAQHDARVAFVEGRLRGGQARPGPGGLLEFARTIRRRGPPARVHEPSRGLAVPLLVKEPLALLVRREYERDQGEILREEQSGQRNDERTTRDPVSYTHLTLPTN